MKLYIGNKNYSSWSMRPWVLLTAFGIAFEEVKLRFDFAETDSHFHRELAKVSPAARVPVLVEDDGFAVWDTLAITEYVADQHPELPIWPRDARQRARARSVCAEMHSGFGRLRSLCPMNIEAYLPELGAKFMADDAALRADLARMDALWSEALRDSGGPWLFGEFSAADAYFAPVVMRVTRFSLPLSPAAAAWVQRMEAHPAVAAWVAEALLEKDWVPVDEPYRQRPGA
jgi:glutathione S-transferase